MTDAQKVLTLRAAEAFQQDIGLGTARLDKQSRESLAVGLGDIVEIRGQRATPGVVSRGQEGDEGKELVRLEAVIRRNAGIGLGDLVQVKRIDCPVAESVSLAPVHAEARKMDLASGLEPFVKKALNRRPFSRGDILLIPGVFLQGGSLPFLVASTQPKGFVQVGPDTRITIKEETVSTDQIAAAAAVQVTWDDVGGAQDVKDKVREIVELPLNHPEFFQRVKVRPPRGVLLYGPPGTGKTQIARAAAGETSAHFIGLSGPELAGKTLSETTDRLQAVFDEAKKNLPCVIFIDEIDTLAPRRDAPSAGETARGVVGQLLTLMDGFGMDVDSPIVIIGATNRIDAIDPALRRPGRFDREILVPFPNKDGRKEILGILLRRVVLPGTEVDHEELVDYLGSHTEGYGAADLDHLVRETAMVAIRRFMSARKMSIEDSQRVKPSDLLPLNVTRDDFIEALLTVMPSSRRGPRF